MRVAVLQSPSPMGDTRAACVQAERALLAAGAMGAAVLVLPEVWLPGYNQGDIPAQALAQDSPVMQRLSAAAKAAGCALVVGYAEAAEAAVGRWRIIARCSCMGGGNSHCISKGRPM
jgi:5-aminopentanamidase